MNCETCSWWYKEKIFFLEFIRQQFWERYLETNTTYHEGCVVSQGQKSNPQPVQYVDHSGHPCVLAERHDTLAGGIDHPLVVQQSNVLPKNKDEYSVFTFYVSGK